MAVVIKPSGPMIGLDIGSSQIRIVEARATRDGVQITGMAVVPTPEELYLSGTIIDPKALGQFIKKTMAAHKIAGKRVVSAISGQSSVVVRIVEMSKMSDKELKDTMKWEVERHVPFAASDIEMDFVPIPNPTTPEDAQTMEVLLVVAQREALNLHLQVLDAAGLQPVAIDVAPLAAGRALVDVGAPEFQNETVAVVNVGSGTTDINIFRNGTLAFTRPMPLAGETFTRAVVDVLGKSTEEAEALKREHGAVLLDQIGGGARSLELDSAPAPAPAAAPEPTQMTPPTNHGLVDLSQPLGLLGGPIPEDDEAPSRPSFDLSAGMEEEPAQTTYDLQAPFSYGNPEASQETTEATPEAIFDLETVARPTGNTGNGGPLIIMPDDEIPQAAPAQQQVSIAGLGIKEQIFQAIQPILTDFVTELRRSLDYYRSRSGGEEIKKVILCGGGAQLANLDAYLSGELGIVVDIASLGPRVQCSYKGFSAQDLKDALPVLPVSLGLAIRDMVDEDAAPKAKAKPKPKKKEKAA